MIFEVKLYKRLAADRGITFQGSCRGTLQLQHNDCYWFFNDRFVLCHASLRPQHCCNRLEIINVLVYLQIEL